RQAMCIFCRIRRKGKQKTTATAWPTTGASRRDAIIFSALLSAKLMVPCRESGYTASAALRDELCAIANCVLWKVGQGWLGRTRRRVACPALFPPSAGSLSYHNPISRDRPQLGPRPHPAYSCCWPIESNPVDGGQIMKGRQMIEAWNLVGLDYATLDNHEFDFGPDTLHQRIRESHCYNPPGCRSRQNRQGNNCYKCASDIFV